MAKVAQGRRALARVAELEQENAGLRAEVETLRAELAEIKTVPKAPGPAPRRK
jgi:uncharacterized small protein (DUF1192 family)